jgi:RNA methyltransferase, TrmH family
MISKNKIKYIQNLYQKKQRDIEQVFLAEGDKIVTALIDQKAELIQSVYATKDWIVKNEKKLGTIEVTAIEDFELKKISSLQTPNSVISIVQMGAKQILPNPLQEWVLVLDGIQDPGNMGTIIRLADWYGIQHIVCNHTTVDCYNPKVIQSTMGSFLQVHIHYTNLQKYLTMYSKAPIYAALLNGKDVTSIQPPTQTGIIVIGNEGNGISPAIIELCATPITIIGKGKAESLNAAVATGIILSHLVK